MAEKCRDRIQGLGESPALSKSEQASLLIVLQFLTVKFVWKFLYPAGVDISQPLFTRKPFSLFLAIEMLGNGADSG